MKQKSLTRADASGQYTAFGEDYSILKMAGGLLDYPNNHTPVEVEDPNGIFIGQSYSGNGTGSAESYVTQFANYGIKASVKELEGQKGVLVALDENPDLFAKVREAHLRVAIRRGVKEIADSHSSREMRRVSPELIGEGIVKALADLGIAPHAQMALFEKAIRNAKGAERG